MRYGNKIKYKCNTCNQTAYYRQPPTNRTCQKEGCDGIMHVMKEKEAT